MPYNQSTGQWEYEDDSVAKNLKGLLSKSSDYMTGARSRGMAVAQSRGLLNSSIAAGAGERAALDAALPIASQDAAQTHQKNLQAQDIGSKEKIATMNIASHNREKAAATIAATENAYAEAFRTIAQQHELPAAARNKYTEHLGALRDSQLNLVEQIWGIDLDWPSTGGVTV